MKNLKMKDKLKTGEIMLKKLTKMEGSILDICSMGKEMGMVHFTIAMEDTTKEDGKTI